jgi:DNA-binding beta-propeller fold protein YncE
VRTLAVSLLALAAVAVAADAPAPGYKVVKKVPVAGDGGWDYVAVDEAGRRVYVSHGTQVDVLDADSGEHKGTIPDTKGVHGIAVASELGRGFTSNGRADSVTVFDLKTLKPLGEVKTGKNPDAILYDPATKRVFAFNGGSASATVIDAAEGKAVATLPLGGQPEFAVSDGAGHVFVNVEDKNEVLKIDARKPEVLERWSLAPGKTPTGLSLDAKNHRLFAGCRNEKLVVVDAQSGKVVADLPIGKGVDATAYDADSGLVFSSCADGTVSVVRQDGPDKYTSAGTIKTKPRSKTMGFDLKTHRLYIPAAEFKPAEAGNPRARPTLVPGSFEVLILEK